MKNTHKLFFLLLSTYMLFACSGDKTFNHYAKAGDTIAIATGWKHDFNPGNISIQLTPASGPAIDIPAGDPAIRASINLYPDPLSSFIISRETVQNLTPYAQLYAQLITSNFTEDDNDWYQTVIFLDLPQFLPVGLTGIQVVNIQGASSTSEVEIIDGTGESNPLTAQNNTNLSPEMLAGLSRVAHYQIAFTASTLPSAIELTLSHDPDNTVGGTGRAFAVNPLGYRKNLAWSDDGYNMKVIMTPAKTNAIDSIVDYKFYVAGNIQNLVINSVSAFDLDGNAITGVSATSTMNN